MIKPPAVKFCEANTTCWKILVSCIRPYELLYGKRYDHSNKTVQTDL